MEGAGRTRRQATNKHKLVTDAPKSKKSMRRAAVRCVAATHRGTHQEISAGLVHLVKGWRWPTMMHPML
eukprot:12359638-Alexandrium_andersonii.AAC.1